MHCRRGTMTWKTAAFAVVLLGASASVSAQPGPAENSERIRYSDTSKNGPAHPATGEAEWVQLASPTPASHGTEFLVPGDNHGPFTQLRIDADGRVELHLVKIYFVDGSEQIARLYRVLGGKQRSATIEVSSPQAIDRLIVTTDPNTKGAYAVYGSSTAVVTR